MVACFVNVYVYRNTEVLLLPLTAGLPSITSFLAEPVWVSLGLHTFTFPSPGRVLVSWAPSGEEERYEHPFACVWTLLISWVCFGYLALDF